MDVIEYKTERVNALDEQRKQVEKARDEGQSLAVALKFLDSPYVQVAHEFVEDQNKKINGLIKEILIIRGEL